MNSDAEARQYLHLGELMDAGCFRGIRRPTSSLAMRPLRQFSVLPTKMPGRESVSMIFWGRSSRWTGRMSNARSWGRHDSVLVSASPIVCASRTVTRSMLWESANVFPAAALAEAAVPAFAQEVVRNGRTASVELRKLITPDDD